MDNVIQFPKKRDDLGAAPVEMEDVENKILNLRHHHINETLSTIIPSLFASMESSGFILEDPDVSDDDIKDGAFVVEAIVVRPLVLGWLVVVFEPIYPAYPQ